MSKTRPKSTAGESAKEERKKKNKKMAVHPTALSAEMIELELEYLQIERSIKLKAIADREAVELAQAHKRYILMKSRLLLNSDVYSEDNRSFDGCTSHVKATIVDSVYTRHLSV